MAVGGSTAQQLLRTLEERAKELESLKKDFQKSEKERKLLESQKHTFDAKQPTDVQTLIAQRRELHAQLKREESEKHELLTQINQLIGEIATKNGNDDDTEKLKSQLDELTKENETLKKDFGRKEAAFQSVSDKLEQLGAELERRERSHQRECTKLTEEIQDCQREIEHKAAALQSLTLAKQGYFRGNQEKDDSLRVEIQSLQAELQEKDDLLKELTESNDELGKSLSETGTELDDSRRTLSNLERVEQELRKELNDLKEKMQKILEAEISFKDLNERIKQLQQKLFIAETKVKELHKKLEDSYKQIEQKDYEIDSLNKNASIPTTKIEHEHNIEICSKCEQLIKNEREKNEQQIVDLKQKLNNNQFRGEELLNNELKNENENLRQKLDSKTEKLTKVENFVESLEKSVELIEKQNQEATDLLNEKEDEIEHLHEQMNHLRQEIEFRNKPLKEHNENELTEQIRQKENLQCSLLESEKQLNKFKQRLSTFFEHSVEKDNLENLWEKLQLTLEKYQQQSQRVFHLDAELNVSRNRERLANETVNALEQTVGTFAQNAEKADILRKKLEERSEHEKKIVNFNILNNN